MVLVVVVKGKNIKRSITLLLSAEALTCFFLPHDVFHPKQMAEQTKSKSKAEQTAAELFT